MLHRVLWYLGGLAAGVVLALIIAAFQNTPGQLLKEARSQVDQLRAEKAKLETDLGKAAAAVSQLIDDKADLEAELEQKEEPYREQLSGGVDLAEKTLDPFGSAVFKEVGNDEWEAKLIIGGEKAGVVAGRGQRDRWESLTLDLFFWKNGPGEATINAGAALLEKMMPLFKANVAHGKTKTTADWLTDAIDASSRAPYQSAVVAELSGWAIKLSGSRDVGLYIVKVTPNDK